MRKNKIITYGITSGLMMLIMILDTKTAIIGAREGISLCLQTVIPSLFPFFILSGIISSCFNGRTIPLFHPIAKLCKIPKGYESIFLLGLITGYPVGAQLVDQEYKNGSLTKENARRMLGFCSNAGPSFIFGMLTSIFTDKRLIWALWVIHILSAILAGFVLPGTSDDLPKCKNANHISISLAMDNAIRNMARVSAWVIVFRVVIKFCERWFLWIFSSETQVFFSGLLELSNGTVLLPRVQPEGLRFIIASVLLASGGLCVAMQTQSVTGMLGFGCYFPGKILQCLFSFLLSFILQDQILPQNCRFMASIGHIMIVVIALFLVIFYLYRKIVVDFVKRVLYNTSNKSKRGTSCYALSKENSPLL